MSNPTGNVIAAHPKSTEDRKFYVIEIALRKGNPIHRCVGWRTSKVVHFMNTSYEDGMKSKLIGDLAFFRIVEEIVSANAESFPNQYKLASEAVEK